MTQAELDRDDALRAAITSGAVANRCGQCGAAGGMLFHEGGLLCHKCIAPHLTWYCGQCCQPIGVALHGGACAEWRAANIRSLLRAEWAGWDTGGQLRLYDAAEVASVAAAFNPHHAPDCECPRCGGEVGR